MWTFVVLNAVLWLAMTTILVIVPDALDRWIDLTIARAIAWAIASGLWVIVIERQWRARMGALARFPLQVGLWASAALVATWISDLFRVHF
jgi:hypothetical protein